MDLKHIRTGPDLESISCAKCGIDLDLPKDGPFPLQRAYLATNADGEAVYAERPIDKRRPDGSEGIALSPIPDAIVDFVLSHKHNGEDRP